MSESGDYSPAPYWRDTHTDFSTARRAYTGRANRSYDNTVTVKQKAKTAKAAKKPEPKKDGPKELVPANLVCQTESGLIFVIDITNSMADWPGVIFSKLPYLEHELKVYFGESVSVSVCACGDAFTDAYPVQIYKDFVQGADIGTAFNWIKHERDGGMGYQETYDLPALFYLKNAEFPRRVRKPTMIYIADECWYPFTNRGHAKDWSRYNFEPKERFNPKALAKELKDHFSVYTILKPYTNGKMPKEECKQITQQVLTQWSDLFGSDRVICLPDANRVVDCVFGIMAEETGKWDYFVDELKQRQLPDSNGQQKVDIVLEAVHPIHHGGSSAPPKPADDADLPSIALRDDEDAPARDSMTMDFH